MATSAQIAEAKAYMRLDSDDILIGKLLDAAYAYLSSAGCTRGDSGTPSAAQYDLAAWALCLHYYDHRDSVGTEAPIPIGAQSIIRQLSLAQKGV